MNKNDQKLLLEAYLRVNEGFMDRVKARGAQVAGTVQGLGNQVAGAVKGAVAGLKGDAEGVKAAQNQRQAGAIQGQLAKINSYKATASQKFKKVADEIFADLEKLGINLTGVTANNINMFIGQLDKAFNTLIQTISTPTTPTTPTAPAAPAAPAS